MAVYARPEPSFRRAYVQPVRRRWSARRQGFLVHLGLLLGAAAGAAWSLQALMHADVLRIDTITVEGNRRLTGGEVAGLVELLRGENLFAANLEAGRENLLASGWIRTVRLRRVLPSAVHVALEEREPIGLSRFGSHLYLIDATGHVIDEFGPRFADLDLPVIDGLSADAGDSAVDARRAALAARLMTEVAADPDLATRVSQVDVANPHDAVVLLNGDPVRIHLGEREFVARLRTYLDVVPVLREAVPDIDYVDVRFDAMVYVGAANAVARARPSYRRQAEPAPASDGRRGAALPRAIARVGLAPESGQRRQRGT